MASSSKQTAHALDQDLLEDVARALSFQKAAGNDDRTADGAASGSPRMAETAGGSGSTLEIGASNIYSTSEIYWLEASMPATEMPKATEGGAWSPASSLRCQSRHRRAHPA